MNPPPAESAPAPVQVTVHLAPHHAAALEDFAQDADVTLPALCAFVLERYALRDRPPPDTPHSDLERLIAAQLAHVTDHLGELLQRNGKEIAGLRAQVTALSRSPGRAQKAGSLGS